jgi:hypothetical protein
VGRGLDIGEGLTAGVGVAVAVGVGDAPLTAASTSTRPQPYTLFGGPAAPHNVESIWTAELFNTARLASIWFLKLGMADHKSANAPEMWGVAIDVPNIPACELSLTLLHDRVPVPGAVMSGFVRLLPSVFPPDCRNLARSKVRAQLLSKLRLLR